MHLLSCVIGQETKVTLPFGIKMVVLPKTGQAISFMKNHGDSRQLWISSTYLPKILAWVLILDTWSFHLRKQN